MLSFAFSQNLHFTRPLLPELLVVAVAEAERPFLEFSPIEKKKKSKNLSINILKCTFQMADDLQLPPFCAQPLRSDFLWRTFRGHRSGRFRPCRSR